MIGSRIILIPIKNNKCEINISLLKSGMYLLRVNDYVTKLIVQR
jgi:hypothetical protein